MKDVLSYFFGGMAVAMVIYLFVWIMTPSPDPAKVAYESYLAGENATTVAERKDKFNVALEEYKKLESAYDPRRGSGALYYNIGNSYFQLEEYPWAIYYYYKSLMLSPNQTEAVSNLNAALVKMNLPAYVESSFFEKTFLLRGFSLPTRFQIFFFSAVCFFAALVAYLWMGDKRIIKLVIIAGCFSLYFLGNTFYENYVTPVQGVLVKAVALYRDAGDLYAKAAEEPLVPGQKVEVLDQRQAGSWLKILTPAGQLGYVRADSIRLL